MARTKEMWHIPKRGNVHQTIYLVHLLATERFSRRSWSRAKQEMLATEMGKAGVTASGKALTHQSVRTLLANLPKYLGFVYIDESSTPSQIIVTNAGYKLLDEHKIESIPKHKKLGDYDTSGDLICISDAFEEQMSKLIITNPVILRDCKKILVFPFRMTLKLLLELDYLDKEEIGYILFHAKSEDELELLVQKIKNFRSMPSDNRTAEIDAYKRTEEGNLTLVQAASSNYYIYLCESTGICERFKKSVNKTHQSSLTAIKLKNKDKAAKILAIYGDVEIYDFGDNIALWIEYFSDPNKKYPPFNVSLNLDEKGEFLVLIHNDHKIIGSDVLSEVSENIVIPVFDNKNYCIDVYELDTGNKIYSDKLIFNRLNREITISIGENKDSFAITKQNIITSIDEMISRRYEGFDKMYYHKLCTIQKVLSLNYVDNRRMGGRLEYLFFKLLDILKEEGVIDDVYWYGKIGKYGIDEPAPGGKEGNPDIVFDIDDFSFVLELTTIIGTRAQWNSSEASSVPDHICKYKMTNTDRKIIGIFSAPSIHPQVEKNLFLNAKKDNVCMIFEPCSEFANFLASTNRNELLEKLIDDCNKQMSDT